jgi:phosphoribosylamine--glycine ligase/phosphoribosylformylglycinamidine cyclo-ligase
MRVLIVGSGGREHALAWKLAQSPRLTDLFAAPGSAAIAQFAHCVPLAADDAAGIAAFSAKENIDLVVVGPEAALAAGVADALHAQGIAVFGPDRSAARLESSKAFAKAFMEKYAIPTARYASFTDFDQAADFIQTNQYPFVLKASGLAAGKGVILPETTAEALAALRAMMIENQFGSAGSEVVIEERLQGEEVSLLAFCDGIHVALMPPAQDHKRLRDGDQGPNTGGMGAYAPAPVLTPAHIDQIRKTVFEPFLRGLQAERLTFIGVIYAGLILTADGPKVLEFNVRFGDPETQVILPLLKSDLLTVLWDCTQQRLSEQSLEWSGGSAVCVVQAAPGYPQSVQTGGRITGIPETFDQGAVFHAGTRLTDGDWYTAGGRVLGVTAWDDSLEKAVQRVYTLADQIEFAGRQMRRDIARRALQRTAGKSAYAAAGVDIDAGNRAVQLMKASVRSTFNERVLADVGAFGGLFDAAGLGAQPVLVASTDGVGTKVELAARMVRYAGIGMDIVNHCVDDILVQAARPLFFLDYFATAHLDPVITAEIVSGMVLACRACGCAILGGETAEMPGVYTPQAFDVAGTIVGMVERDQLLPRKTQMQTGDVLIGIASSGPHTNGYSLIRKLIEGEDLLAFRPELNSNLADALLAPHRAYFPLLQSVLPLVHGMAHITGGGFLENIPRVLPEGLQAQINWGAWPVPPLFTWLQQHGDLSQDEMARVFNLGIGMVLVTAAENCEQVRALIPEETWVIGSLRAGNAGKVVLQ